MIISNSLKKFINDNIDLLRDENLDDLYLNLIDAKSFREVDKHALAEFNTILYTAGIDPLDTLTFVPEHFEGRPNMEEIVIPSNVKRINSRAFEGQPLTKVTFSEGLLDIDYSAFSFCPITNIILPNSLRTLEASVFYGCEMLTHVHFGSSLTKVGAGCFNGCRSLKHVAFQEGLTDIHILAFSRCTNLKVVNIPRSIKFIGPNAFFDCGALEEIVYSGTVDEWNNVRKGSTIHSSPTSKSLLKVRCLDGVTETD